MLIIDKAAKVLQSGGVIAYPTEGVFGLGCLPENIDAVTRVLQIKQRDAAKGLILIAATASQFEGLDRLARHRPSCRTPTRKSQPPGSSRREPGLRPSFVAATRELQSVSRPIRRSIDLQCGRITDRFDQRQS